MILWIMNPLSKFKESNDNKISLYVRPSIQISLKNCLMENLPSELRIFQIPSVFDKIYQPLYFYTENFQPPHKTGDPWWKMFAPNVITNGSTPQFVKFWNNFFLLRSRRIRQDLFPDSWQEKLISRSNAYFNWIDGYEKFSGEYDLE